MERVIQEKLHAFVTNKMNINKGKTKYFQVGGKVKILGMMILPNGRISPDSKKKQELETMLHFYITDRPRFNRIILETKTQWAKSANISEDDYPDILSGNLSYVDSIDPEYTDKLRRKFGAVTIDTLIHQGFSSKK
jgi:RNA-directed DNA polymerase